jgi:hypothetical protein
VRKLELQGLTRRTKFLSNCIKYEEIVDHHVSIVNNVSIFVAVLARYIRHELSWLLFELCLYLALKEFYIAFKISVFRRSIEWAA